VANVDYPTPFTTKAFDGTMITRNATDMDGIEVDPSAFAKVFNAGVYTLLRSHPFLIFVSFFAALDGILFGYDTGVISGAIVFDGFREDMSLPLSVPGQVDDSATASTLGWIVASLTLGAAFSSLCAGQIAHMIGRKPAIVIGAAISTIGGIVQSSASDVGTMIAGRIVVGVGIGIVSTVVPIYVAGTFRHADQRDTACMDWATPH
jgi:MFS family permease